jgi:predicted phosphoribosyltransferase
VRGQAHIFADRAAAGRALGRELQKLRLKQPLRVLALPRGGVPVACEVARILRASLEVIPVRKVGMPGQPELAIGAIASGNVVVHEAQLQREIADFDAVFAQAMEPEVRELARREQAYRPGLPPLDLRGETVVLVDDGLATGSTMLAALRAARKAGAARIVVAAPVASHEAMELLAVEADDVVILQAPALLWSIGGWYEDFDQLDDAEVMRLLDLSHREERHRAVRNHPPIESS